jgi:hypothetical protein
VTVFVPIFPIDGTVAALASESVWRRFAALRDRVEAHPTDLVAIRDVLGPLETELWEEANEVAGDPTHEAAFLDRSWRRIDAALHELGG